MTSKIKKTLEIEPSSWKIKTTILVILSIVIGWSVLGTNGPEIPENGVEVAGNIMQGILTPSLDKIFSFANDGVLYLLLETIAIAFLGTLIGSIFAIIPAFLGSSNITNKFVQQITRFLLNIIRTIPAIVYGIMFIKVTGPGAFAGVMTFSVTSIGMVSKLYIEAIEEVDSGILEAMNAAGANYFQRIRYGILPQLFGGFMSISIYRFEINVKDAAILGLVGAGGLGTPLILAMAEQRWNDVGAYLLGLIILVLIVEFFSGKIRNKLTNG